MSDTKKISSENRMGSRRIFPLLLSMALPPMLSMFIQSMYNIVDSIFVARLGEDAITALSLVFPLQNLVLSVSVGFGVGLGAVISTSLGAGKSDTVNEAATCGIWLTALHAVLFLLFGLLCVRPYLGLFTENAQVLEWGTQYGRIVVCLAVGQLFHINFEKMFQAVGNMLVPMLLQMAGALINILLDPILIFGMFGCPALGVSGAAIATVIGQMSACLLSILLFARGKHPIRLQFRRYRPRRSICGRIYSVGVPSAVMAAMPSVLVSLLNGILASVSQTAVAVFGLYYKVQTFVYMPSNGTVQGMRPILSYNYGAGNYSRVRKTLAVATGLVAAIMLAGTLLFCFFPRQVLGLFDASPDLLEMGVPAFRILCGGFLLSSVGVVFSGGFEALGRGFSSLTVSVLRQLVIIPPLALLLLRPLGITGIWIAFPIAEGIAAVIAFCLMWRTLRRLCPLNTKEQPG